MEVGGRWSKEYYWAKTRLVPPTFIVFFTGIVEVLALEGKGTTPTLANVVSAFRGTSFSWCLVAVYFFWVFIWLKIPSKKTHGQPTLDGFVPQYQNNGVQYYLSTMVVFIALEAAVWPGLFFRIYNETPAILGTLNTCALALCFYLYIKAESKEDLPPLYLFYRGVELHPRVLGVDVKQFTNCRVGLMAWQLLIVAYFFSSHQRNGFNLADFTTMAIQTAYLFKFFCWEDRYFWTLDMTLDRAGYYMCWGCLVWMPCLFTYTSYLMVAFPAEVGSFASVVCLVLGLASVLLNYLVDEEKRRFRHSPSKPLYPWNNSPPKYIKASYLDSKGDTKTSFLLTSGSWGLARHLNYTLDSCVTLFSSLPAFGNGVRPFFCYFFLLILFVHRCFRDEEKCSKKYGKKWDQYCALVPYRLIPFLF